MEILGSISKVGFQFVFSLGHLLWDDLLLQQSMPRFKERILGGHLPC